MTFRAFHWRLAWSAVHCHPPLSHFISALRSMSRYVSKKSMIISKLLYKLSPLIYTSLQTSITRRNRVRDWQVDKLTSLARAKWVFYESTSQNRNDVLKATAFPLEPYLTWIRNSNLWKEKKKNTRREPWRIQSKGGKTAFIMMKWL